MSLTLGTRLGPYEILSPLGAGGMGEVYRARDTTLNRNVAIKVLPESVAKDSDRLARFEREAQVLASLNHPNIAHIHGLEQSDGVRALVMELVEGEDLSQRIARGAIPLEEALPIARQIAEALEAAHEQGIVHRDLKPANIKVRPDGTVKVLDFGLAKALAPDPLSSPMDASPTITSPAMMTGMGVILGTAAYMSPEQARGKTVDKRADIWAFGCVLYEMLSGQPVFRGETITDVLAAVVRNEPDLTRVPWSTRRLLRSCLEKDSHRRLQAIGDAWLLLDETAPEPSSSHWRRVVPWVAAAASVVVVGAALWTLWRKPAADARAFQFQLAAPPGTAFQTGAGGGAAVSPDGRAIAFLATSGGSRLWVRRLDSPTAYELPGTTGAALPFWAPDSRALGFFAEGKLKKIDLSGSPPVVIAAAPYGRGGSWTGGGTIVFAVAGFGALQRVAVSGGIPTPLTTLDRGNGETLHRWPHVLPDGRKLLYFVRSSKANRTGVYLAALDQPDEKVLVVESASAGAYAPAHGNVPGHLFWVRDHALMAQSFDPVRAQLSGEAVAIPGADVGTVGASNLALFSLSQQGTLVFAGDTDRYRLAWFSRDGRVLGTVSTSDRYASLRMSPDGNDVAVSLVDASGNRDIWAMDLARGLPNRLTKDGGYVSVWSPDGSRIAYHDASQTRVVTMGADGDRQQTVMESPGLVYINDWSPDGQFLMYTESSSTTSYDLWLLPTTEGGRPVPLLVTPFDESHGQFFPNGPWIAYTSNESGQQEIYVRTLTGKGSTRVSTSGGSFSRWRKDGGELFYRSLDGRLMAVTVVRAGDELTFGTPVSLLPIVEPFGTFAYPYDVAPDGQKILALTPGSGAVAPLTVIVNWAAGLRKGM